MRSEKATLQTHTQQTNMTTPKDQEELRELEKWIAVKLFGWGVNRKGAYHLPGTSGLLIGHYSDVPRYTSDPAKAMLVLEKCAQKLSPDGGGGAIAIEWTGDIEESWRVSETDHHDGISAEAQTLALAIGRFAKSLFTQTADKLEGK